VPEGSRLLLLDEMRRHIGGFDPATLTHVWRHPDPRVDALHDAIGTRLTELPLTPARVRAAMEAQQR